MAYGYYPTIGDLVKIARLYQNGGRHGETAASLWAAHPGDPRGEALDRPADGDEDPVRGDVLLTMHSG